MRVRRVELHLFPNMTMVLAVSLDNVVPEGVDCPDGAKERINAVGAPEHRVPLSLADAMVIHDRLRRVYPPYFEQYGPARCPDSGGGVEWLGSDGGPLLSGIAIEKDADSYVAWTARNGDPPVFRHWSRLLEPAVPRAVDVASGVSYRQILDERMSLMFYLAVDDPRAISLGDCEGEWMRLAMVDDGGEPETYPYAPEASRTLLRQMTFDLWWSQSDSAPAQVEHATRVLCSGFAFGVVTPTSENAAEFPVDERLGLLSHFRHHYYKIGLIVHFHRAALMQFEVEIAGAIERSHRRMSRDDDFFPAMKRLEREFFEFRSRYWFTEVSPQFQAQRLFDLWSGQLGNLRTFDEVASEVLKAGELVSRWQGERQQRGQHALALGVVFLSVAVGLVEIIGNLESYGAWWHVGLLIVLLLSVATAILSQVEPTRAPIMAASRWVVHHWREGDGSDRPATPRRPAERD